MIQHKLDINKILQFKKDNQVDQISTNQAIFYSLALGFNKDPLKQEDFKYTYELNDNFQIFPTYACVLHQCDYLDYAIQALQMKDLNPNTAVHGEHRLEIYRPLQINKQYITSVTVQDFQDKGTGSLLTLQILSQEFCEKTKKMQPVSKNLMSIFLRKLDGQGYKGKQLQNLNINIPKITPNAIVEEVTRPDNAIYYRLCQDRNPFHIDPKMAKDGGFPRPILHGLCFYGLAAKGAMQSVIKDQFITKMIARFKSYVFPGETIIFSYWIVGKGQITFTGKVKERNTECIIGQINYGSDIQAKL